MKINISNRIQILSNKLKEEETRLRSKTNFCNEHKFHREEEWISQKTQELKNRNVEKNICKKWLLTLESRHQSPLAELSILKNMKMKNKNKDKWAFFFQYAGQEIVSSINYPNIYQTPETAFQWMSVKKINGYASLRPIESLTDGEMLTLAKIIYPFVSEWSDIDRSFLKNVIYIANEYDIQQSMCVTGRFFSTVNTDGSAEEHMASLEAADYLRSISIALPFRGYSVEEMIEWGWVKLREG